MDIVDTSNGPAIRDNDGYIILPGDIQGLVHVSTLDNEVLNALLDSIADYVTDAVDQFKTKVRVDADGQISAVAYEDISETVQAISRGAQSASLMTQVSQGLLNGLVLRPTSEETGHPTEPATYISFPAGYHFAVVKIEPGVVSQPVSYYPEIGLIPEDVRRGTADGAYEVYAKSGSGPEHRFMAPDEVLATLPAE